MAELDGVWRLVDLDEHKRRVLNSHKESHDAECEYWYCMSGTGHGCRQRVWLKHKEIWLRCIGEDQCQPYCVCLDCWPVTAASRRLLLAFSGADGG